MQRLRRGVDQGDGPRPVTQCSLTSPCLGLARELLAAVAFNGHRTRSAVNMFRMPSPTLRKGSRMIRRSMLVIAAVGGLGVGVVAAGLAADASQTHVAPRVTVTPVQPAAVNTPTLNIKSEGSERALERWRHLRRRGVRPRPATERFSNRRGHRRQPRPADRFRAVAGRHARDRRQGADVQGSARADLLAGRRRLQQPGRRRR